MKILFPCLSKSWGGMEMVTLTGIQQLIKQNIKVRLICAEESRLHLEADSKGIIIHPIKIRKIISPYAILKLSSIIRKEKYDLIHTHASKDLWLIVPALKTINSAVPLVLTKHIGSFITKRDIIHNWFYKRITKAIAISSVIKRNLKETTSLTEQNIQVIFNGVNLEKFNPQKADRTKLRNELKLTDYDLLIGMTARFSPGKGHEEFLLAAKELSKKNYSNHIKFVIVGEASRGEIEYEKKIKNLIVTYNLENVHFLGYRIDIPDVLAAMDILVLPSHAEAFGIALVEAMAMEKASVCSNSDGVLDFAVDNETSYLFKVKDANDLKLKLEKLIFDEDKRKIFGLIPGKELLNFLTLTKQQIKR
ncbi:MAG: glycosyltransferase family 4 protein [Ignavibacteriaceae bacterium]